MLRAVGGLATAQIAAVFLVPESTMAQRVSRAKQTIRSFGMLLRMPEAADHGQLLGGVLHVLYLIFKEGYTATGGTDLTAPVLSAEAIRLTRLLQRLLPDDSGRRLSRCCPTCHQFPRAAPSHLPRSTTVLRIEVTSDVELSTPIRSPGVGAVWAFGCPSRYQGRCRPMR